MGVRNILLLWFFCLATSVNLFSQETKEKKDTTKIYKKIETYSKRSKFTKLIYGAVFKPVATNPAKRKLYRKLIVRPYSRFEGKIIRNIDVVALDPFGYSIADTLVVPRNFLPKTGNLLHQKTLPMTIRNLMLIKRNQVFDSLLVKESERLIRSRDYLRDVSFFVQPVSQNSDSVDLFVRVLDIWSIIPTGSISASSFSLDLNERNFLGLGHGFENLYGKVYATGETTFNTTYTIPNFKNSYVGAKIHFDKVGNINYNRELSFDRPFFSPFAKWAAGVKFIQQYHLDSIQNSSATYLPQSIKLNV